MGIRKVGWTSINNTQNELKEYDWATNQLLHIVGYLPKVVGPNEILADDFYRFPDKIEGIVRKAFPDEEWVDNSDFSIEAEQTEGYPSIIYPGLKYCGEIVVFKHGIPQLVRISLRAHQREKQGRVAGAPLECHVMLPYENEYLDRTKNFLTGQKGLWNLITGFEQLTPVSTRAMGRLAGFYFPPDIDEDFVERYEGIPIFLMEGTVARATGYDAMSEIGLSIPDMLPAKPTYKNGFRSTV